MKGILLAGGRGTRLFPATLAVSKQLLPVYDKPMVYYPLSTLMLAGITQVLLISTPHDTPLFERLLGDGRQYGLQIDYAVQPQPGGVAQGYVVAREWLNGEPSCLVLGDNVFYGHGLPGHLKRASTRSGMTIFGYRVQDPQRYGVVEYAPDGSVLSLEEKPANPRSDYAVIGLYFCDGDAPEIAAGLQPSQRGELEIVEVMRHYQARGMLCAERLGRGYAWLDTGTHEALLQASNFIEALEKRQGMKIACLEEIAFENGLIDREQLRRQAAELSSSDYGCYLERLAAEGPFS
jgi:glucose-1-phosphate thymidylyltransferase